MNFHKWIRKHFGRSIVKFLIGLLILIIIASAVIYLLTQFDYSHLLPSGSDTRSYVANSDMPNTGFSALRCTLTYTLLIPLKM